MMGDGLKPVLHLSEKIVSERIVSVKIVSEKAVSVKVVSEKDRVRKRSRP